MPIENKKSIYRKSQETKTRNLQNLTLMVKHWAQNFEKGEHGEKQVAFFLAMNGFQVNPIIPWNFEKSEETMTESHHEDTRFSPDFFFIGEDKKKFLGESKAKTQIRDLGMLNKSDYMKYYDNMKDVKGIGFKLFWVIAETKEIWAMDKLVEPDREFKEKWMRGRLVYIVPKRHLRLCGNFDWQF